MCSNPLWLTNLWSSDLGCRKMEPPVEKKAANMNEIDRDIQMSKLIVDSLHRDYFIAHF